MPKQLISGFSGGEVSPDLYGRSDAELYYGSAKYMQNFIARMQGSLVYRGGTAFVHPSRQNQSARLERFKFNDEQTYILEFTDGFLRIYEDTEITLETSSKVITGATQANPVVITANTHGFSNGDEVYISGVAGMTELNGRFFRVANQTTNTFELLDLFNNPVNGTGFTAYSSGGNVTEVLTIASPYTSSQLFEFQFAQQGNVMYLVHRDVAPYKLTRLSATSWSLATYSRTADPFTTTDKFPGCVTFYEGRAIFASSNDNPDTFWASRSPEDNGDPRYDDFTTGSDADHALIFPISSSQGEVEYIVWIAGLRNFIALGTTSGISGLDGGGDDAITPDNLRVRPIDPYGAQAIMPISNGASLYYVQKGGRILRSFEFELLSDNYQSFDRSFLAAHLTEGGIKQIAFQRGRSDIVWLVMNDGRLVAMTVKSREDVSGWHRYKLGGSDVAVLSVTIEPQVQGYDRVWVLCERSINEQTVRYLEFFDEPFEGMSEEDFYTGDEDADHTVFINRMFEEQRAMRYLDSYLVFDGSDIANDMITLTPGATTGASVTFTASSAVFAATDVGKELQKKYTDRGGGGRALITAFINSTTVTCQILVDFDSTEVIMAGKWYLTTDAVTGLFHLEGETVSIVADGAVQVAATVVNGTVSLDAQFAIIVVGYGFIGIYKSLNLILQGGGDNSLSNNQNIVDADILFANSVGSKYGTSLYRLQQIESSMEGQLTDRPPLPVTGVVSNFYEDTWEENKHIVILQDEPYPCLVNALNLTMELGER